MSLVVRIALAARPTLRRVYGWRWPLALLRELAAGRALVRRTRWAARRDEEARFIRALSLLPAICAGLQACFPDRASELTRELATAFLKTEGRRLSAEAGLLSIQDPRERWHAFFDRAMTRGTRAFDETECVSVEPDRFHVRVFRCLLAELSREAGVAELAQTACAVGVPACSRLLPSYRFHRDGSGGRTLAHGADHCDYIWERQTGDHGTVL